MADNVTLSAGTADGAIVATDQEAVTNAHFQYVKVAFGADNTQTKVASGTGLPVAVQDNATADLGKVDVASLDQYTPVDLDTGAGTINALPVSIRIAGAGATVAETYASGTVDAGTKRVVLATDVALPAGTNAIGKLAANSGVDIGDVDILSIAAGDNNIGNVDIVTMPNVTLAAGTNTNEVVGDAAHDAAAAGNPVLVAGIAQDMDDTAPPNRVSAEADAVRVATDRDGSVFVHPHGPQVWSYHSDGSTALTDASVHAAPGAGLSLYVTDIVVSTGAATAMNVFFEEGVSKVLGPYYLEAVAGRGLALHFQTPKKITANTALTVTTSAAIAQCVDVMGFTAQG